MQTPPRLTRLRWLPLALAAVTLIACSDDDSHHDDADGMDAASDALADTAPGDASDVTADDDADTPGDDLEIVGTWVNDFGDTETITTTTWDNGFSAMNVIAWDNTTNVLLTQNPPDDAFNPDTFNRIVWTEPSNNLFHYCIIDFGLASADEARDSTATADPDDLTGAGCGGFPWTQLTAAP